MYGLTPYRRSNSISSYFDDFEKAFFGGLSSSGLGNFRTDIVDKGNKYLLQAELPGVAREDINIELDGCDLIVNVKREESKEEKQENYVRRERSYGAYSRRFDVTGIDTEKICAAYKDGVLELSLPKREEGSTSGRRIEIE